MATYYIDPIGGSDSNDGLSEATPCASMDHVVLTLMGKSLSADGTMYEITGSTASQSNLIILMRGTVLSKGFSVPFIDVGFTSSTNALEIRGGNNAFLLINSAGANAFALSMYGYTTSTAALSQITSLTLRNLRCFANRTTFCQQSGTYYRLSTSANYAYIPTIIFDNTVIRGCTTLVDHTSVASCGAMGGAESLIRNIITEGTIAAAYETKVRPTRVNSIIAEPSKTQEVGSYTYAPTPAAIMAGEGAFLPQPSYVSAVTPGLVVTDYNFSPATPRSFLGSPGVVASAWVDDVSYPHGTANISTSQITIATGPSARVLSPVQVFPEGISFSTTAVSSIEDEGAKDVLDSTPADSTRTIDVRVSDTPFTQLDASPAWVAIPRNSSHQLLTGKYVQFRITLTTEGA